MANKLAKRVRPADTVTLAMPVQQVIFLGNGRVRITYQGGFSIEYAPDDTLDVVDGGTLP